AGGAACGGGGGGGPGPDSTTTCAAPPTSGDAAPAVAAPTPAGNEDAQPHARLPAARECAVLPPKVPPSSACRLSVRKASARSRRFINWDPSACCGVEGEGHAVPIGRMQVLWTLVLRASATASTAAEMTAHSNSMACGRPRRGERR